MTHPTNPDEGPRDLVWESLVSTAGTMRLAGNFSAHLILEAMVKAHEDGTMGELARLFEEIRPAMPYDHPAVTENVERRIAVSISA